MLIPGQTPHHVQHAAGDGRAVRIGPGRLRLRREAHVPGSYPGPFSAISPQSAAFVGYTPPMGYGAAPLEMAASGGAKLAKDGNVSGISVPEAVVFISPSQGLIVGQALPSGDVVTAAAADGGYTWTRQYQAR